ncbi:hypothetical protein [Spiroplasma diminutum]|uniref:Uncharacterized protein n=1 Tax=Spiroplasma diminutum CUAS-1 TaxID=1276221 RepID=S5MIW7_9MOLU|nr:hypothetical protein [Spiroplasma diminutum]AGR41880.1 hypothetical protein SDIMI_v3c01760 [Spiroplasma diminutum CUAS-1]
MEQHLIYPFCCTEHSTFFSTLLENYIRLRATQDGISIINDDFKIYKELTNTNLKLVIESEKQNIKRWKDNLILDLEKKLLSISSLIFIYYVFYIFEIKIDKELEKELQFLKDQSLNLHNSIGTKETESAFKLIFQLIEDINQLKNLYIS